MGLNILTEDIGLGVRDMEKAIKFYRDGLGYKTDCREDNPPQIGKGFGGITLTYNDFKYNEYGLLEF